MENNKKELLKNSLEDNETFIAFLQQEARSDEYRQLKSKAEKGPHPTGDMLYDYVQGYIEDINDAEVIRKHVSLCGICSDEVIRIRSMEEEAEDELMQWADTPVTENTGHFVFSFFSKAKSKFFELFKKTGSDFFSFEAAAVMAVCLIIIFLFVPNLFISGPGKPSVNISLTGYTYKDAQEIRGDDNEKKELEEFELKENGILKSGDRFSINITLNRDTYVYLLSYDTSKKINLLFSGEIKAGKPVTIPDENKRPFRLDNITGVETIFVLASEQEIDGFDEKTEELENRDIDDIDIVFPKAYMKSFRFKHE